MGWRRDLVLAKRDAGTHLDCGDSEASRVSQKHLARQGCDRTHARMRKQPACAWPWLGFPLHLLVQLQDPLF